VQRYDFFSFLQVFFKKNSKIFSLISILLFFSGLKFMFFNKQKFNKETILFSCVNAKKVGYLQFVTIMTACLPKTAV